MSSVEDVYHSMQNTEQIPAGLPANFYDAGFLLSLQPVAFKNLQLEDDVYVPSINFFM